MDKTKTFKAIDFSSIKPGHVRQLVEGLYNNYPAEKRDFQFGLSTDRRQLDRRLEDKFVLLDTRDSRSRRQSACRRQHDENQDNQHKVGIDFYI